MMFNQWLKKIIKCQNLKPKMQLFIILSMGIDNKKLLIKSFVT